MANLKEVKNRINSVKSTQQITKAMKMVAASKLRRAQTRLWQMRPYANKLASILENVSSSLEGDAYSVYAQKREVSRVLIVVVSSDKGLCGAFNSNLFKKVKSFIGSELNALQQEGKIDLLTIGSKGYDHFHKKNYSVLGDYKNLQNDPSFENIKEAAVFVMDYFKNGQYDQVYLAYNEFKNVATQIQRVEQFLPLVPSEAQEKENDKPEAQNDYIFEPSVDYIINELIPQSLKVQFYKAILESGVSEQGARMTAMDQATDNAGELLKELRLTYNRTRQAAITKEILEIVSGADALGS